MKRPLPRGKQSGWQVFVRNETAGGYWNDHDRWQKLWRYKTLCATCGEEFLAHATASNWRKGMLRRRCDRHKQPRVPVDNKRSPLHRRLIAGVGATGSEKAGAFEELLPVRCGRLVVRQHPAYLD